ncbi:MAG: tail fiber domain-containing protein [Bacteroidota bacterium]
MKKTFALLFIFLTLSSRALFSQNVGIGSSNPILGKLVVEGVSGSGATNAVFGNAQAGISLQQNWPTIGFNQFRDLTTPGSYGKRMATGYSALLSLSQDNGVMFLEMHGYGTANTNAVTNAIGFAVTPSGNVSIHHGAPNASLDVVRGSAPEGTAAFRGTLYNSHFNYSTTEHTYLRGGKASSNVYVNDIPTGNIYLGGGAAVVGINTINPPDGAGTLVISQNGQEGIGLIDDEWGNLRWEINGEHYNSDPNDPSSCLMLRYSGRANPIMGWFRPTDGGYSTNSDRRLKENIIEMEPVLKKILTLQPVRYKFKVLNKTHRNTMGLIAQDVNTVFPELVDHRQFSLSDGQSTDLYGMDYSALSVLAISAIKEQQQQIEALKKQVELLSELLQAKIKQ